jgi:Tol biopolymer transport system component
MHENPRWAPDGRHIAFAQKQGGVRRIFIMASDGSGKRALTGGNGAQYNPAWSPPWGISGSESK